jgi:hypothetical protein
MKTLLIAVVGFCVIGSTYAQSNVSIKLYVKDNAGRIDSVTFGLKDSSTVGTDLQYGEANIFGTSMDTLDVRVVQRDSLNFNCIQVYPWSPSANLYFPNNIDSKVDYRPFSFILQSLNDNFEIQIKSEDYPVVITADFNELTWHFLEGWSSIHLLDSNCLSVEYQPMEHFLSFDTLFVLSDSTFNTLVAHFEHELGIETTDGQAALQIFPNPTDDLVSIKSNLRNIQLVIVQNTLGQTVLTQRLRQNTFNVSLHLKSLPTGIYHLTVGDDLGVFASKKLLKVE